MEYLFRKTEGIRDMPRATPNEYVVTLHDLETWQPVDITIDERLTVSPTDPSRPFGANVTEDGELWVAYLEKAIAIHAKGYNNINGGWCLLAWSWFTGCKETYLIGREHNNNDEVTDKWGCQGRVKPGGKEYLPQFNSSKRMQEESSWNYRKWPEFGGGGELYSTVDVDALFDKMVAWDEANFLMAASTFGKSDGNTRDGIVDCHAYSLLRVTKNVAGSGQDLLLLRNTWANTEMTGNRWGDDGPGWDEFPEVKQELNPTVADDGLFWCDKEAFHKYFNAVLLCAKSMA